MVAAGGSVCNRTSTVATSSMQSKYQGICAGMVLGG